MLLLKPLHLRHYSSLLSTPLKPLAPPPSSLRFLSSNPKPLQNPNPTMSAPRNASDVLMAAARAAAQKKAQSKTSSSSSAAASSPKKRKPDPPKPPTPNPNPSPKVEKKEDSDPVPDPSPPRSASPKKQKTKEEAVKKEPISTPTPIPSSKSSSAAEAKKSTESVEKCIAQLKKKASEFKPELAAYWKEGEPVPFLFLVKAFDMVANESGRNVCIEILCNVFRTVIATTPKDLVAAVYLSANKIAPAHEGIELGIGDSLIIRVLAEAYGRKEDTIKSELEKLGDLGLVAKACRSSQRLMFKPAPLTVAKVLDTFRAIAKESGKDSMDKKRSHVKGLLVAATDCEPQYLIRLLQAKLRIGLAEQTVLVALGQAAVYSEKKSTPSQIQSSLEEAGKIVKQVYSVLPNYEKIITALLDKGVLNLSKTCSFTIGVPIGPMLAKPTTGVSEILNKFENMEFTCEYKYDGERAQIHYLEDGSVEIYSRNAERNTGKYPDVVKAAQRFKKASVKSFVLDCEVVAYDRKLHKILPFQVLSTRARKDVIESDIKVKVCIFAFDILFLNGQPLLQEQLQVRREHLYNSFDEVEGEFQFATAITSNDIDEIQTFLDAAVNSGCEGLIIKTMNGDATYEPSKRSLNWLKLKKDYMESFGDSLDLVPIAAYHGQGKRTGFYGAFLLACYDDNNEEYQSVCRIGTGFTEAMLAERSTSLRERIIPKPPTYYRYGDTNNPDVWFEPSEVWEVKAADLSISPHHQAGIGIVHQAKGISLRFPRLIRVREDKRPDQATTSEQVADMYRAQKIHSNNNKDSNNRDDDD